MSKHIIQKKSHNKSVHHVCQFMSDDGGSSLFVSIGGGHRVIEEVGFPVRNQTPVLHCTKIEVWQSNLICEAESRCM